MSEKAIFRTLPAAEPRVAAKREAVSVHASKEG